MLETIRTLYGLQELDRDIFRVGEEVRRLPEDRARRRVDLDAKLSRRNDIDQELQRLRLRIKEIEDDTTQQRQRQRKLEHEASSSRGDAALLAAFQHEIRSLRRDIGEAEEEGLALLEKQGEFDAQRAVLQAEIDEAEADFAEYSANVERELAEAQTRLEGLRAERAQRLGKSVPANVLEIYEKLLQAREGVAMCALEIRTCQGCYMEVPPNTRVRLSRGIELIQCPSCDRILYLYEQVS